MRSVPDWSIQVCWWASGIFATGAVWYFLSTREYVLAILAAGLAVGFAVAAVVLHRKKDALAPALVLQPRAAPSIEDKLVNSAWWEASDLRKGYESRGFNHFHWSNANNVAEREQQSHEVVFEDDYGANKRFRMVNRSGQVLMARRDSK